MINELKLKASYNKKSVSLYLLYVIFNHDYLLTVEVINLG